MSLSSKILGYNFADTISAIATAPGLSGISVIRISGPKAISITDKIFTGKIKPSQAKTSTIHFGSISDPSRKKILDEVLLSVFRSPHSYTGEDMIEISCHGGDFVSSTILKLIIKLGARLAESGEFTRRRVFNGKMDITQAEAVLDLVSAKTETTYHSALDQMQGKLTRYIQNLTQDITSILAQMENLLEFEEDNKQINVETRKLSSRIQKISTNLEQTIEKNHRMRFFRNGVYCVIIGRPNVGKSSLFNRLAEMDRAIVTEIAGTTRDSLEQMITINRIVFHLIDTAGLKILNKPKGIQKIEALGIEKSRNWLEAADFVLVVFDNSHPINKQDYIVYDAVKNKPHLLILNKIDLKPKFNQNLFSRKPVYAVSAKFNQGISKLKTAMNKFYTRRFSSASNNYLYLNTRHIETLSKANDLLKQCVQEKYLDVSIMHLRNALDILGTVTNAVSNEQVLDSIFAQFCIGK